jgi:hypothetical protein
MTSSLPSDAEKVRRLREIAEAMRRLVECLGRNQSIDTETSNKVWTGNTDLGLMCPFWHASIAALRCNAITDWVRRGLAQADHSDSWQQEGRPYGTTGSVIVKLGGLKDARRKGVHPRIAD